MYKQCNIFTFLEVRWRARSEQQQLHDGEVVLILKMHAAVWHRQRRVPAPETAGKSRVFVCVCYCGSLRGQIYTNRTDIYIQINMKLNYTSALETDLCAHVLVRFA